MINRTILVGRLTKDPEHRVTPNGVSVTINLPTNIVLFIIVQSPLNIY